MTLTVCDGLYVVYFVLHIVVAVLIDSSLAISAQYRTQVQLNCAEWHINKNKDFLLANPPAWLVFCGWIEVLVQFPCFFVFTYAFLKGTARKWYSWIAVYGLEAAFTTLLCMISIYFHSEENGLNTMERNSLLWMYSSTLVVPLAISCDMFYRISQGKCRQKRKSQ